MSDETISGDLDDLLEQSYGYFADQSRRQRLLLRHAKMLIPPHRSQRLAVGEGLLSSFNDKRLDATIGTFDLDVIARNNTLASEALEFAEEVGGRALAFRLAVFQAARMAQAQCRIEAMKLRDAEYRAVVDNLLGVLLTKVGMFDQEPPSVTMTDTTRHKWQVARDRARDLILALEEIKTALPKPTPRGATEDFANRALVSCLAVAFRAITGRKAGKTRGGPFARFAVAAYMFLGKGAPPSANELEPWLSRFIENGAWADKMDTPTKSP